MKKALIFYGGWAKHEPELVSARFASILDNNRFEVHRFEGTKCLEDAEKLSEYDLIVPCTTLDTSVSKEAITSVSYAVSRGTGIAGCHGGMCDAFRDAVEWQFITGGQWVAHPGGDKVDYTVNICKGSSPIVEGIEDFSVCSEQYYLHVDPAIEVLATTRFPVINYRHASNKPVDMPVVWTKSWGLGRIFYCSLGHQDNIFDKYPQAQILMERGMLWASGGKEYAKENNLDADYFDKNIKLN